MNQKALKALAATILCALVIPKAPAAPGDLDKTFGKNGKAKISFLPTRIYPSAAGILVEADGKIVVAVTKFYKEQGTTILRYNPDGSIDANTNGNGIVASSPEEFAFSMALQPSGKLLLLQQNSGSGNILLRYNADGSLDLGFGNGAGSIQFSYPHVSQRVFVQSDGKILTEGYGEVARYSIDGGLDASFGNMGFSPQLPRTGMRASFLQSDGKIVITGYGYDSDSDPGDNGRGSLLLPRNAKLAVARVNTDGSLDQSFGTGGLTLLALGSGPSFGSDVKSEADGKIVVVGEAVNADGIQEFATVRFQPDGSLDKSFNGSGVATLASASGGPLSATAVALQEDGKILVMGYTVLVRYNQNGTLDRGFHGGGKLKFPYSGPYYGHSLVALPEGDILVGAYKVGDTVALLRLKGSNVDMMVRKLDDSAYVGEEVYGVTGSNQTVGVTVSGNLKASYRQQQTLAIKVRNNRLTAAGFEVKGSRAEAGFQVQYFDSADAEITEEVEKGRYVTPELGAGAEAVLTVRITAQRGARNFATQRCRLLVRPEGANNNADADAVVINAVNVSP